MIDKNFRDSLTFRFFNESINVALLKNKFDYILNSVNESHEHRYLLKFNRIFYNLRGVINYAEITIQGIPMTESILVVHAIVKNREQKLRTKVKCSFDEHEKQIALDKFQVEFIDKLISICTIGLNEIPDELKIEICKHLNLISLFNLANSNRFWYDFILTDDLLWKKLFIRDYGTNRTPEANEDWKTLYKNEFIKRRTNKTKRNRWLYRSLPSMPEIPALPWLEPWNDHPQINPLNPIPLPFIPQPVFRRIFDEPPI